MTNDTHAHDGLDSGGKQNQIFLLFLPVHSKFHEFVQLPKGHFSFKARHKKIKFKLVIEHQKNRNQRTNRNEKELFETLFAAAAAFCCNRKTKKKNTKNIIDSIQFRLNSYFLGLAKINTSNKIEPPKAQAR